MRRREFIQLSTGLLIACRFDTLRAFQGRERAGLNYPTDFNIYLHIDAGGRVTCFVGKVELGQGNMTSLAQLAAEELSVRVEMIDMVMGDTARCPWDMGTFGSMSIPVFGPVLRRAAAEARDVLREIAAERLRVPLDRLVAEDGAVHDKTKPDVSITYAELAGGKRIDRHRDPPPLKSSDAVSVIGRSIPRRDAMEKVTGHALYAGDLRRPGMLYAKILRPPAHGATLKRVDTSAVSRVPGAQVVREGDFIAVLHEHPDEAARALSLVVAEFDPSTAALDDESIFEHLTTAAPAGQTVKSAGDLDAGGRLAAHVFDDAYFNAYVAHAPMETHTALAVKEGETMTVWASTQAPFSVQQQVASALKLPAAQVRVITPYVGGGFGGKVAGPQAVEAARLAALTGKPIQVTWDRGEEFFFDTFRPAAVAKVRSAVDAAGKIVMWDYEVFGAGDREAAPFYDIPHLRVVSHGGWSSSQSGYQAFNVGAWRAPSVNSNTFARELQIDLMAAQAGVDPLEFRLKNLTDARMRTVLETAAKRFGWTPAKAPSGRGVGVACAMYSSTRVAAMADVTVDRASGRVHVNRVVCAQDMGQIVNPDGARMQVEGCITMGLGYTLGEEVRFKNGAIFERNFDTYQIPRFSWLPAIETILVDSPGAPASAGGEPAIVCMGAVVANAIHDAAGIRLRVLPMTAARVKAALAGQEGQKVS